MWGPSRRSSICLTSLVCEAVFYLFIFPPLCTGLFLTWDFMAGFFCTLFGVTSLLASVTGVPLSLSTSVAPFVKTVLSPSSPGLSFFPGLGAPYLAVPSPGPFLYKPTALHAIISDFFSRSFLYLNSCLKLRVCARRSSLEAFNPWHIEYLSLTTSSSDDFQIFQLILSPPIHPPADGAECFFQVSLNAYFYVIATLAAYSCL